jgi:hypothetical protein
MHQVTKFLATTATLSILSVTPAFAQAAASPNTATGTPKIMVITPQSGQTIYGDKVPILFSVNGLQLTDYNSNPYIAPGQGHVHVWLDDQNPTNDTAKMVVTDNTIYSDVPAGNHTLKAELVNNDHTSFNPPELVTVSFKTAPVGSPAPAPSPTFDRNTALIILVIVALVILAAWWYTKDEEDEKPVKEETVSKKPTPKKKISKKKPASKSRRK